MIERLHLSVIILVAAGLWGLSLLLEGVLIPDGWYRPFSMVVGVLMLLLAAFDTVLWRLPFLQGWLVKRPDLRGTWRATIESRWMNPETRKSPDPIEGYMVVRQSFSSISLRLMTDESRSEMLGAEILRSDDGTYRVVGVYRNEPKLSVRHRSPIHNGGLVLQVTGAPAVGLEGTYWTDRDSSGEILLGERRAELVDDMAAARRLYKT